MRSVLQDSMRMKHRDVLGLVKKVNNFSLDFTNRYISSLAKTANNFILCCLQFCQIFCILSWTALFCFKKFRSFAEKNCLLFVLLTFSFPGFGQCFGFASTGSGSYLDPDSDQGFLWQRQKTVFLKPYKGDSGSKINLQPSVPDPRVFWPPGSGSTSQRCGSGFSSGSGSGSFYHHAKK